MKRLIPIFLLIAAITYGQDKEYVINFTKGTIQRHDPTVCDVYDTVLIYETVYDTVKVYDTVPVNPGVFFQSDFENITLGTRTSGDYPVNNWLDDDPKLKDLVESSTLHHVNEPTDNYAYADIRTEPGHGNVLYMWVKGDNPSVGGVTREQLVVTMARQLDTLHFSYDVKFDPGIALLTNYSNTIHWNIFYEIWEDYNSNLDGDMAGQSRIELMWYKDYGAGKPLYYHARCEMMQPASQMYQIIWDVSNTTVAPVFGQWINMDICLIKNSSSTGRFVFKVDGQTIFDVIGAMGKLDYLKIMKNLAVMKLYADGPYISYINSNGGRYAAMYDNFKWYKK